MDATDDSDLDIIVDVEDTAAAAVPITAAAVVVEVVDVVIASDMDVSVLLTILPSKNRIDCIIYGEVN